jgi:hypothetical protein
VTVSTTVAPTPTGNNSDWVIFSLKQTITHQFPNQQGGYTFSVYFQSKNIGDRHFSVVDPALVFCRPIYNSS